MKDNWQITRNENIRDYITAAHIIGFLIYAVAFIGFGRTVKFPALPYHPLITIFILLLIYNIVINSLSKKLFKDDTAVTPIEVLYLIFPFILALAAVVTTGHSGSPVKSLLLIPAIIAGTARGKIWGSGTASAASIYLLGNDLLNGVQSNNNKIFESDLILAAIIILTGWLVGGLIDIEKEARLKLIDMTNRDDLTELYNHRYFQSQTPRLLKEAKISRKALSLIMLDLDMFRLYNEIHDYETGDKAITATGRILANSINEPAFAARYGGDKFAIVLPDTTSKEAKELAEKISREIENFPYYGRETMPMKKITASFGVASFPEHANSFKGLIQLADEALYRAKFSYRNRVQVYFSIFDNLQQAIDDSKNDLINVIKILINIINARDRYTAGHSERVLEYSVRLGQRIGLSSEQLLNLTYAAYLHDIGKIEIDRNILNKPGLLRENEWEIIKQHTVWGKEILQSVEALKGPASIILYHHENYDGSGYPSGVKGKDIPVEARILRLADSFDAMTTSRPYKRAKTIEGACQEIEKLAGKWFDPHLAKVFIEIIKEKFQSQRCEHLENVK